MVNKQYKYHFIYKTINLLNNKYYIGMHSTDNLEDGYLGSGKILKASIKRHGKENFKLEILEWLPNRLLLKEREKELVDEILIKDKLCMNLQLGGGGGLSSEEHAYKFHAAGGKAVKRLLGKRHQEKMKTDLEYRSKVCEKIKQSNKKPWKGKKHKEESKLLMSEQRKGTGLKEKNSQYGTCWITNDIESKKIKREELQLFLSQGWSPGRTV